MGNRFFRKVDGNMLAPLHEETEEWLGKQPIGKQFKANMKSTRNPGHHRKAFALLKLVLDNQDRYTVIEDLLVEFKLRAGHYEEHVRGGSSNVADHLRGNVEGLLMAEQISGNIAQIMLKNIAALEREAKVVYLPKSISFDEMGQEEFEEIYDRFVGIACQMIGVEDDELRRELSEFGR